MNLDCQIREFSFDNDYGRVLALWEGIETGMQVGRSDTPEEIKRKLERDPDLFLVAEIQTEIVGSVIGGFDGRRGMVYHLAVRSDLRQQGIGAALLAEVEKRLIAKGCVKVYLLVMDDNLSAMRFYEERGWHRATNNIIFMKEF